MEISIDAIIARYNSEIGRLTQRAILAEARADMAETRLAETAKDETAA